MLVWGASQSSNWNPVVPWVRIKGLLEGRVWKDLKGVDMYTSYATLKLPFQKERIIYQPPLLKGRLLVLILKCYLVCLNLPIVSTICRVHNAIFVNLYTIIVAKRLVLENLK